MDHFEALVRTLLEADGYWVRQSFKVNLSKEEKRKIGKPSIPRPEIDLLALNVGKEELLAIEVKSYLDSPGVRLDDLRQSFDSPEGRFKLFTSKLYRCTVFSRLRKDLKGLGMLGKTPSVRLRIGLVAGKIYRGEEDEMADYLSNQGSFFWGPTELKKRLSAFAKVGYENDPVVLATKVLLR